MTILCEYCLITEDAMIGFSSARFRKDLPHIDFYFRVHIFFILQIGDLYSAV